jgi:hypothetical protein
MTIQEGDASAGLHENGQGKQDGVQEDAAAVVTGLEDEAGTGGVPANADVDAGAGNGDADKDFF